MSMSVNRAVFLDRDGVINRAIVKAGKPYPPASVSELEALPGVREALVRLRQAGWRLIVVTNQPDVARGTQTRKAVELIHRRLLELGLPLDEFLVCYHDSADACACRKPRPGLLLAAAHEHRLHLAACYLVGDRWRDVEAGQRAGCRSIFIDHGYNERRPEQPFISVGSLAEAAERILSGSPL